MVEITTNLDDALKQGILFEHPNQQDRKDGRSLAVFVNGFSRMPINYQGLLRFLVKEGDYESVKSLVVQESDENSQSNPQSFDAYVETPDLPDFDLLPFHYASHRFSRADPELIAQQLGGVIEELWNTGRYSRLYLIGHSMGALFVRQAVLNGVEEEAEWAHQNSLRLILLAGTNRGYVVERLRHSLFLFMAQRICRSVLVLLALGLLIFRSIREYLGIEANSGTIQLLVDSWPGPAGFLLFLILLSWYFLCPVKSRYLVEHVLRGSRWIAKLRLRWIRLFSGSRTPPETIQVRGEKDTLVNEDDSLDLYYFPGSAEIVIPGVKHSQFQLTPQPKLIGQGVIEAHERYYKKRVKGLAPSFPGEGTVKDVIMVGVWKALTSTTNRLHTPEPSRFNRVVFLIHGIRDFGGWHESLGNAIEQEFGERDKLLVVPITYGYFSALQFILPAERHRTARVFLDRYVQEFARSPSAEITVAAHSNGTFVFGHALASCAEIRIKRAYLAGSVLPREYRWNEGAPLEIEQIRNDCASSDWPVGVLCRILSIRWIGLGFIYRDIGTGGVDGFVHGEQRLVNNQYLSGGHGSALAPSYHSSIARFLKDGRDHTIPDERAGKGIERGKLTGIFIGVLGAIAAVGLVYCISGILIPSVPWAVAIGGVFTFVIMRLMQWI